MHSLLSRMRNAHSFSHSRGEKACHISILRNNDTKECCVPVLFPGMGRVAEFAFLRMGTQVKFAFLGTGTQVKFAFLGTGTQVKFAFLGTGTQVEFAFPGTGTRVEFPFLGTRNALLSESK